MTDNKKKEIREGKVKFLTPVVYFSTPQLAKKGLVIVDLEQLVKAQQEFDKALESIRAEALKDLIEEEYGNDLITSIDYYNIGKLVLAKLSQGGKE